jgi:hypothetical protein
MLDASLKKDMLPEYLPAASGTKVTVKGTLCRGETINGKLIPLRMNPVPSKAAEDTVIGEPPAIKVPVRLVVVPAGN